MYMVFALAFSPCSQDDACFGTSEDSSSCQPLNCLLERPFYSTWFWNAVIFMIRQSSCEIGCGAVGEKLSKMWPGGTRRFWMSLTFEGGEIQQPRRQFFSFCSSLVLYLIMLLVESKQPAIDTNTMYSCTGNTWLYSLLMRKNTLRRQHSNMPSWCNGANSLE